MNCGYQELFSPVQKQRVKGTLCRVRLGRLCGPTLINAEQEEICRLYDRHLHVHLDSVLEVISKQSLKRHKQKHKFDSYLVQLAGER